MDVQYFGWSGIAVKQDDALVGFDLFGDAVTWDALGDAKVITFCLTHGHPEHVGSLRGFLADPKAQELRSRIHVVSSPEVLGYINRGEPVPASNVHRIDAGDQVTIGTLEIAAFAWRHAALLPPGLQNKAAYVARLVRHSVTLGRIGIAGLRKPLAAPTLGYRVMFSDGSSVLNYSEGLHRHTDADEVASVARELPADTLLFGVEPEDTDVVPRWIETLHPKTACLYEPHRPWRDSFGLPSVDLDHYSRHLATRVHGVGFRALTEPQQTVVASLPSSGA